jgi:phenylacetic acid degradation operon negative regulatory protein
MTETISPRVLVFGLSRADGRIPGEELYRIGEACGLNHERIRSCLRRLLADGALEREHGGRGAGYSLSPLGRAALRKELERYRRAYERDGSESWEGRWHLAAFTLDEASRPSRDHLRDRLIGLGGIRLMGGLYLSASPWETEVRALAEELGVGSMITLSSTADLEVGGERDPIALAARFWPLGELAASYRNFVRRFTPAVATLEGMRKKGEPLDDAVFLPAAFGMSVAFQTCFDLDPLLPRELLPQPWAGTVARELVLRSRRFALSIRKNREPPALFRLFDATTQDVDPAPPGVSRR